MLPCKHSIPVVLEILNLNNLSPIQTTSLYKKNNKNCSHYPSRTLTNMSTTLFMIILAMLAMANAAPVQEEQKNLQGLLDALTDQKTHMESVAQAAKLIRQQQDDDGNQEAEAQFLGHLIKALWVNKQQDYNGNEAEAQFIGRLLKNVADVQQDQYDDDTADAQFWGSIFRFLAPHAIKYVRKRLG